MLICFPRQINLHVYASRQHRTHAPANGTDIYIFLKFVPLQRWFEIICVCGSQIKLCGCWKQLANKLPFEGDRLSRKAEKLSFYTNAHVRDDAPVMLIITALLMRLERWWKEVALAWCYCVLKSNYALPPCALFDYFTTSSRLEMFLQFMPGRLVKGEPWTYLRISFKVREMHKKSSLMTVPIGKTVSKKVKWLIEWHFDCPI